MMIKRRLQTLVATLALVAIALPAWAGEPTSMLQRSDKKLRGLLKKQNKAKGVAADKLQTRITATVNAFLNFEELARLSLKKHWDKRSETERSEFVQLLRDLIERNYLKQLRKNLDYKLEYRGEVVKGQKAKVTTAVKVVKNKRPSEVLIEYKMKKVNGKWMVYDVITDEVSIVRNYRSQFNRIIKRKSYQHLVEKMRSKLQRGGSKKT